MIVVLEEYLIDGHQLKINLSFYFMKLLRT